MRKKRVFQPIPEQNCGNCLYFKKHYIRGKSSFLIDDENGVCSLGREIGACLSYSYKGSDCNKWQAKQNTDATLDEIKEVISIASEMLETLARRIDPSIKNKEN
ncbi:MAG: hypothetical protein HDQ88_02725 [Clostridia bacterium]|nr:hypothetical protein [Clostridia bacterium]